MSKPKFNIGGDGNHKMVKEFFKHQTGGFTTIPRELVGGSIEAYTFNYLGHPGLLIDFRKIGGIVTDYYVEILGVSAWLEVKTPETYAKKDHDMTDGEQFMYDNSASAFYIIVDEQDIIDALDELIAR